MDWYLDHPAQRVEAPELVVDERFEWADVEDLEAGSAAAGYSRDKGKERRFGLAAGGRGSNDHIGLALEHHRNSRLRDVPQLIPALLPDPTPDGIAKEIEDRPPTIRGGSVRVLHRDRQR